MDVLAVIVASVPGFGTGAPGAGAFARVRVPVSAGPANPQGAPRDGASPVTAAQAGLGIGLAGIASCFASRGALYRPFARRPRGLIVARGGGDAIACGMIGGLLMLP